MLRTHAVRRMQPTVRLGCLAAVLALPLLLLVTPGHQGAHLPPSSPALSSGAPHR